VPATEGATTPAVPFVLAAPRDLADEAGRLAWSCPPSWALTVRELESDAEVRSAVSSGRADLGLVRVAGAGSPSGGRRAAIRPVFPQAVVLGVPAVGPRPGLSLASARDLLRGMRPPLDLGLGPGVYEVLGRDRIIALAAAGKLLPGQVAAIELTDLGPAVAGLAIDGVAPEPGTVRDGTYALAEPVALLWGGNLPALYLRWLAWLTRPNLRQVAAVVEWATGPEAMEAYLGLGDLCVLHAVGDVMLCRGVGSRMSDRGPDYPFLALGDLIASADVALCNLESHFGEGGAPIADKGIWFRAPPEAGPALLKAGFDLVGLANNHSLDYGRESFVRGLEILSSLGLRFVGAGRDVTEARRPLVIEARGVRIAFVGFSQFAEMYWSAEQRFTFAAGPRTPGVASLRVPSGPLSPESVRLANPELLEDLAAARRLGDVVVALVHWGTEYRDAPDAFQVAAAQALLEGGAQVVLGHHPHVAQGLQPAAGGLVAYSLGNFIFDQSQPRTQESFVLRLKLSRRGVFGWDLVPVRLLDGQPRPVGGSAEGEELRSRLESLSWELCGWGR
jgi:poly-gamma-glutamate synthesis protein (capsule biosynthesis protein)